MNDRVATSVRSPLSLRCGATINNRLCKSAMTEGLATSNDHANEQHNTLYKKWSLGGAGLLITGNVMIDRRFLERPGNVVIENENGLKSLSEWARAGTEGGNHLWMQISHPGRQCARIVSTRPLSASDVQLKILANFARPRAMTEAEIGEAISRYARVAKIAQKAGFTGVQIHAAHGYLINQFLSPITNHRTDQWGGNLDNRSRFLLRIIEAVRNAVGNDFPVAVKLNSADFQSGGFNLDDSRRVASMLNDTSVDLLEISGGTYEQLKFLHTDSNDSPDGGNKEKRESTRRREAYFLEYARQIRQNCKLPLIVTGGFRDVSYMNEALANKELEMIGLARPFCTHPDIARQILENQRSELPSHEDDLVLGSGRLGHTASNNIVRMINGQGSVAWYYRQILNLANNRPIEESFGLMRAFGTHFAREYKLAISRKFA